MNQAIDTGFGMYSDYIFVTQCFYKYNLTIVNVIL